MSIVAGVIVWRARIVILMKEIGSLSQWSCKHGCKLRSRAAVRVRDGHCCSLPYSFSTKACPVFSKYLLFLCFSALCTLSIGAVFISVPAFHRETVADLRIPVQTTHTMPVGGNSPTIQVPGRRRRILKFQHLQRCCPDFTILQLPTSRRSVGIPSPTCPRQAFASSFTSSVTSIRSRAQLS